MAKHADPKSLSITERFVEWCADSSDAARVQRTVAQAVIIGVIDFVSTINGLPAEATALITLIGMPVLSIIQAEIGKTKESE